ncbi:MAG: tetratricopeptide repeat-containing sensor histidine kinase [Bacteroidia bacterium]|nr:tetratricopeptide repeat-containing sensor histidine kinase [Bacteroidia bacterium]
MNLTSMAYHADINQMESFAFLAIKMAHTLGDSAKKALALKSLGVTYAIRGNISKAIELTLQAVKLSESYGKEEDLAKARINLAGLYYELENWDQTINLSKQLLNQASVLNSPILLAAANEASGISYWKLQKADSAEIHLQCAMELYKTLSGQEDRLANCISSYASMLIDLKKYGKAAEQFRLANNLYHLSSDLENNTSYIHSKLEEAKLNILTKNYAMATEQLAFVLKAGKQKNFPVHVKDALLLQSNLDSIKGNYRQSLLTLHQHLALKDSLMRTMNEQKYQDLQNFNEREKAAADNKLLTAKQELAQNKIQNQRIVLTLVLIALFALTLLIGELIRRNRHVHLINDRLAHNQDIIQQKNQTLEEAKTLLVEQKIELEELNDTKDRWFGVISHDFRHPLTVLQGALALMLDEELSLEEHKMLAQDLQKRFLRTANLLDNLLFWAQNQMGGWHARVENTDIRSLLQPVVDMADIRASEKGIALQLDTPANNIQIATDIEAVRHIVRNLIDNAIKYSYPDQTILIKTTETPENWFITVKDEGIGIPESIKKRLFKDVISSSPGTKKERGSGLGLAISRDFAVFLNGDISVESTEGVGTTFVLSLRKTNPQGEFVSHNQAKHI